MTDERRVVRHSDSTQEIPLPSLTSRFRIWVHRLTDYWNDKKRDDAQRMRKQKLYQKLRGNSAINAIPEETNIAHDSVLALEEKLGPLTILRLLSNEVDVYDSVVEQLKVL